MDCHEEAVMWYLCANGKRFVCPQFPIKGHDLNIYPDFIAVDIINKEAFIVEVSAASNINKVAKKVIRYHDTTKMAVLNYFIAHNFPIEQSDIKFSLFVRHDNIDKLRDRLNMFDDVSTIAIEVVSFAWKWHYEKNNIPINVMY